MQPVITIFCPFTRRWAVDDWIIYLSNVAHDPALTNLCFIVDTNEHYIANMLKKHAEDNGYRSFHIKINEDNQPNEVRLAHRRARIADIHNQSKDLIAKTDGDIIIGLEDDTAFDRLKSFTPLYEKLLAEPDVGYVEGVQMGRWGARIIGAWVADSFNSPQTVKTLLPKQGYQEITAGGFYGYATRRELYLNHDYYTSSSQPWGPDVNYGFYVRQSGYKCLINWDVIYGHRDNPKIAYPDQRKYNLTQVIFTKNNNNGKWDRTDYEQTRS